MLKVSYSQLKYENNQVLQAGEVCFDYGVNIIQGENGSGKTSFLNILYGNFPKLLLKVEINGEDVYQEKVIDYRNNYIAYVSQNNILFDKLKASDNLSIIVGEYDPQKLEFLASKLDFLPVLKSNQLVKKLSGGEKQKLKLLCGLLSEKPILVLDEPFNNLDSDAIRFLQAYLQEIKSYLIITSHIDVHTSCNKLSIDNGVIEGKQVVNHNKINLEFKERKKLLATHLKKLSKINRKNRMSLYIINGVLLVVLLLALSNALNIYSKAVNDRSNFIFADNASIISPPLFNSYFTIFGDESWFDKTPSLFSDEDIERISELPYVETVVPTKNRFYDVGSSYYQSKYSLDLPVGDNEEYTFTTNLYAKEVAEGIPPSYFTLNTGQLEEVITGSFPEDESNEVMLDETMADYLLDHSDYKSYEQLIGETVDVPVININDMSKQKLPLKISAVVKSTAEQSGDNISGTIVSSFDPTNKQSVAQVYSQYLDQDRIVEQIKTKYEVAGLDRESVQLEQIPTPGYDTLYIEVKDPADTETLTKDITKYDKFIEIENNYTGSHTVNFKYLNTIIYKSFAIVGGLLIIFILCLSVIIKLYRRSILNTSDKLGFYGYNNEEITKYINRDLKEYVLNIVISNLVISIIITGLVSRLFIISNIIVLNILIIAINIVLTNFIIKSKLK